MTVCLLINYDHLLITPSDSETDLKFQEISNNLSKGDYLILSTRRLYMPIGHASDLYPVTAHYYDQLFQGKLGYTLKKEISNYPSLFGYQINDDSAEETFQVYDHPKVLIFQNTEHYSYETLLRLINF
jgi:hypothetical protein